VAPASLVKENDGVELLLRLAGELLRMVSGAVASIVQVEPAAVPVLPAVSVAVTWNVCEPSAMPA